ncbi:protein kinase domain-containing protein [Micromonospora sp. NPDC003197]
MGGTGSYVGQSLGGRYRLVDRLGVGGMSVVWRAHDEVLGREVAVKMLVPRLAGDRTFRHRLRMEAKAAARLCHPHITNVYDYGESRHDGLTIPYVVMELVDGHSLATRLAEQERLPWCDAVLVCAEVAAALAGAHARGVVHRDITPNNVMLTSTGAKVVDFGISALIGERDVSQDGSLLGTPAYLAPERLDGGQVSPAADVYALGLLLYRTLSGRLPWRVSTTTQVLRAHRRREPEPMPALDGLPDEVVELCSRCLAKAPGDRPSSAEVAAVLMAAAGPATLTRPLIHPPTGPAAAAGVDEDPQATGRLLDVDSWSTESWRVDDSPRARIGTLLAGRGGVAAVGVGLLAVTGLLWGVTAQPPASGGAPPAAQASTSTCQVEYALRQDSGSGFDADLTVTNTGVEAVRDWSLTFSFPGNQAITKGDSGRWEQRGRQVVIRPTAGQFELAPGDSTALGLTGEYAGGNPLPVEFRLGDTTCGVQVLGVAGRTGTSGGTAASADPPGARIPVAGSESGNRKSPGRDAETDQSNESDKSEKGQGKGKGAKKSNDEDDDD